MSCFTVTLERALQKADASSSAQLLRNKEEG
jgi:hypothetical protein